MHINLSGDDLRCRVAGGTRVGQKLPQCIESIGRSRRLRQVPAKQVAGLNSGVRVGGIDEAGGGGGVEEGEVAADQEGLQLELEVGGQGPGEGAGFLEGLLVVPEVEEGADGIELVNVAHNCD